MEQNGNDHEVFMIYANQDGSLPSTNLGQVLRALGLNPTEAEVKKYRGQTKDTPITFDVFLPILQEMQRKKDSEFSEDEIVEGLRHFDKEGNGLIPVSEFRRLLTTLGERLNDDEVDQLSKNFEDGQGNVRYREFVAHVLTSQT